MGVRSKKILRTFRLDPRLVKRVEEHADQLGLSFTDVLETALAREVNLRDGRADAAELLREITAFVGATYSPQSFPEDITRIVFERICGEEALRQLYDAAIVRDDGHVDEHKRAELHRRIGRLVKRLLDASVVGRSETLDREEHLIETHALLQPQASANQVNVIDRVLAALYNALDAEQRRLITGGVPPNLVRFTWGGSYSNVSLAVGSWCLRCKRERNCLLIAHEHEGNDEEILRVELNPRRSKLEVGGRSIAPHALVTEQLAWIRAKVPSLTMPGRMKSITLDDGVIALGSLILHENGPVLVSTSGSPSPRTQVEQAVERVLGTPVRLAPSWSPGRDNSWCIQVIPRDPPKFELSVRGLLDEP